MRIRTQCQGCGLPFKAYLPDGESALPCPNCAEVRQVAAGGWSTADRRVESCPLCGSDHLYRQRDFNRALGCSLILVGIVFVPWTYGLSLLALSLVDFLLYYFLSEAVVCYRCDTVYRDAKPTARQTEFDLLKHDVLKYGKARAFTQSPPRAED